MKAIHDVLVKLSDEAPLTKHDNIAINVLYSFGKAVIVDTADKVSQEALSNTDIKHSEDNLEKINNTGAEETLTEIGEKQLFAGQPVRKIKFVFEKNILQ